MALENAPVRHEQTRPGDGGAKAAAILGAEGNDRATVGDARANTAAATVREVQSGTLPALQIDDANPADAHRPEQKPAAHDLGFWQTAGSVIGDMVHGAVDEVVHHPGQILEAAAVGVAAGAVGAVALATVPEVAAVVGGAMLIYQGAELVSHVPEWYHDAKVIAHAGENSAEDVAKAHQAFQTVGADTAVIGAGLAGSV
ncbi:MAG TPA: hypothetical protein V6C72_12120, partial [Chroococcales cyanobacterium]